MALLPMAAEARKIAVDFDPSAFVDSGGGWNFSSVTQYAPSALAGGAGGSLQFAFAGSYDPDSDSTTNNSVDFDFQPAAPLQLGGSTYGFFCLFGNASFSLSQTSSCTPGADPTFGLLPIAGLTPVATSDLFQPGAVFSTQGFSVGLPAEGQPEFTAPFDINAATPAIRFWWNDLATSYDEFGNPVGQSYSVQAFLYMLEDGNFDLDVRYGIKTDGLDGGTFPGVERFISVGGESIFSSTDPVVADGDYFFRFRNGLLQGGTTEPPPTNVPEPGTLALLGSGLLGLALLRRRKLRSPA